MKKIAAADLANSLLPRRFALMAPGAAERVCVPKTTELVARELRNRIIRGELRSGDALPGEAALREHFSISRQTLRVLEPDPQLVARYFGLILQYQGVTLAEVYEGGSTRTTMRTRIRARCAVDERRWRRSRTTNESVERRRSRNLI